VSRIPSPNFAHLLQMSDDRGTFEHAKLVEPRREHGYCTDDMARVLVVATRERHPSAETHRLVETALRFLSNAQGLDGDYRNRMDARGHWEDHRTLEDCWGRSLWGLGTAAAHSDVEWVRQSARAQFERSAGRRSPWPRAMAFAALGSAEVLTVAPKHWAARELLADAVDALVLPADDADWLWPEARLTYANAAIPEAMIAGGSMLHRPALLAEGLRLLEWLLARETTSGHLSVTPAGGAGCDDEKGRFDQQPIEVASLADACARAATVDDNPKWVEGIALAAAWFMGENDSSTVMWDATTGGGYDGLKADGANQNEGTESTLALLSTLQHARRFAMATR
jgi:hypothetical protein